MQRRSFARLLTGTAVGASTLGTVAADTDSQPCDPRSSYCSEFAFELGTAIETTTALNVRAGAGLDDEIRFTVPEGAQGRVISRSITGEYTWHRVKWDQYGEPGWSASEFCQPRASQSRVAFGYKDFTTCGTAVSVQTDPFPGSAVEGTIPTGTIVTIFQGPIDSVTGPNHRWWKVSGDALTGWAREAELVSDTNNDPPAFETGQNVQPTTALSVREEPTLDAPRLTVVDSDDTGDVVPGDGPVVQQSFFPADEYLWWKVDWESGPTGWSVQAYLDGN
jgi:uncharacterized protein YgiM (DUF1202 family)